MSSAPVQAVVPELSKERVAELVALLARVVEYAGYEPLVSNVWLLGDATHFPDKWKGGEASFVRLARRGLGLFVHRCRFLLYGLLACHHASSGPARAQRAAAWACSVVVGK